MAKTNSINTASLYKVTPDVVRVKYTMPLQELIARSRFKRINPLLALNESLVANERGDDNASIYSPLSSVPLTDTEVLEILKAQGMRAVNLRELISLHLNEKTRGSTPLVARGNEILEKGKVYCPAIYSIGSGKVLDLVTISRQGIWQGCRFPGTPKELQSK